MSDVRGIAGGRGEKSERDSLLLDEFETPRRSSPDACLVLRLCCFLGRSSLKLVCCVSGIRTRGEQTGATLGFVLGAGREEWKISDRSFEQTSEQQMMDQGAGQSLSFQGRLSSCVGWFCPSLRCGKERLSPEEVAVSIDSRSHILSGHQYPRVHVDWYGMAWASSFSSLRSKVKNHTGSLLNTSTRPARTSSGKNPDKNMYMSYGCPPEMVPAAT